MAVPTKAELRERASSLAAKLGEEVQTAGLNLERLTVLVAELEAKVSGLAPAVESAAAAGAELGDSDNPTPAPSPNVEPPRDSAPDSPPEGSASPAAAVIAMREKAALGAKGDPLRGSRYKVAQGRVLFCERSGGAGLQAGEPIRDTDFDGPRLEQLLKQGAIVPKSGG